MSDFVSSNYKWHGVHPFHTQSAAGDVTCAFWDPLKTAYGAFQRRPDVFFAGLNELARISVDLGG